MLKYIALFTPLLLIDKQIIAQMISASNNKNKRNNIFICI